MYHNHTELSCKHTHTRTRVHTHTHTHKHTHTHTQSVMENKIETLRSRSQNNFRMEGMYEPCITHQTTMEI